METLYLSKRNLLSLLAKLDRQEQGEETHCTIIKYRIEEDAVVNTMDACMVVAVPDEVMYANRNAGPMHHSDEKFIKEAEQ
jgi:hypothetical protein